MFKISSSVKSQLLVLVCFLALTAGSQKVFADTCQVATSDGFSCGSYPLECNNNTQCVYTGEVTNWYDGAGCGSSWECAPSYATPYSAPEYDYQGEYTAPECTPHGCDAVLGACGQTTHGSNGCGLTCEVTRDCAYPTPYGYPSPYGYPTPAEEYGYPSPYGYPTPAYSYQYQYETEYATPVPAFNYSLTNGGDVSVAKNSGNAYGQRTITKTLVAGTAEAVTLSLSGVPSGVSYSLANGTCSPTCTTTINFTVSSSATVGTHTITVTGSPLSKTTTFHLIISQPVMSVTCAASPTAPKVGQPVTWTGTVTGGTSPYTYAWSGTQIPTSPVPSTNPYSVTYTTVGQKIANVTVTDSATPNAHVADCTLGGGSTGIVYINFNPDFEEF